MNRTVHPSVIFAAAAALALVANGRQNKHGAWRFSLGRLRAHVDGDSLHLWHRGAARIWCELRAKSPTPSPAALPALAVEWIRTRSGPVTVTREGDWATIQGPSGTHSLSIAPEHGGETRLRAHVAGFVYCNGGRQPWRPTHHARPSHIALSIHGA